jgi:hypothetical protein
MYFWKVRAINATDTSSWSELRNFTANRTILWFAVDIKDSWNMVSVPGLHPVNQNVNTWWSGKDPAAAVFQFSGGFNAVTEVTLPAGTL